MRNTISSLLLALLLAAPLNAATAEDGTSKESGADFNRAWSNVKKGANSALGSVKKGTQNAWEGSEDTRKDIGKKSNELWQSFKDIFN
jgi:hypothetical protein